MTWGPSTLRASWVRQRNALISSAEMLVLAPAIMTRHLLGLYKATITNINGQQQSSAVIILQSITSLLFQSIFSNVLSPVQSVLLVYILLCNEFWLQVSTSTTTLRSLSLFWVSALPEIKYKSLFHVQIFIFYFSLRQSPAETSSPSVCCWL